MLSPTPPDKSTASPSPDPAAIEAAKEAGLRYVSDTAPGIHREGRAPRFRYRAADGKILRTPLVLERIRHLAIPPAWTDVWIAPAANAHIQATGRDARRRKQYRYHADWRAVRDATKYERMMAFGRALPHIRRRVDRDLRRSGLPRDKVLAALVQLLESTHIRVGNEEYAEQNHSFGLTTLRNRHVHIRGGVLQFHFHGKSGQTHDLQLRAPRLARIVRAVQELPGQELFQYLDRDNQPQVIHSEDVNAYLRAIAGEEFSAKDFRTWAGTVLAALALREFAEGTEKPTKKNLRAAIERVATSLGNTPTICRKCYIHPAVIDGYLAGETIELLRPRLTGTSAQAGWKLGLEEAALLSFLRKRLSKRAPKLSTLLRSSITSVRRSKKTLAPSSCGWKPQLLADANLRALSPNLRPRA